MLKSLLLNPGLLKPLPLRGATLGAGLTLLAAPARAQAVAATAAKEAEQNPLPLILVSVVLFMLALLLILAVLLLFQARPLLRKVYEMPGVRESFSGRVLGLLVGDPTLLTGHDRDHLINNHEYDGIHEYDNDLPPWWKALFYLTAAFAAVYLVWFHTGSTDRLSLAEYKAEMVEATMLAQQTGATDDPNKPTDYKPLLAKADVTTGKQVFDQNCAACHGKAGEGQVGPNLTDEYWLHGGEVNKIFHTIKYGVQGKGMVAWKGKLSAKQMLQVASYILTLRGTNPPNGKQPQGDRDAATAAVATQP